MSEGGTANDRDQESGGESDIAPAELLSINERLLIASVREQEHAEQAERRTEAALENLRVAHAALQPAYERERLLNDTLYRRTQALVASGEQLAEMSQMRQELLRRIVTAQEEERARISRDLHDDTGQQVTALLLGLNNLKNRPVLAADADAQDLLTRLCALAEDVAQKSHRLSFTLRPTALDDIDLMGALENYGEEWSHWSGLPVEIASVGLEERSGSGVTYRLPPEIETTIYRVTQEALSNILRHAIGIKPGDHGGASSVSVLVQRGAQAVVTIVEDDGPGFDVEATLNEPPGKRRLGIFGMQERARLAGGTLAIESAPGSGTAVFLRLPFL